MLAPFGNLINITANAGGSLPTGQCSWRVKSDIDKCGKRILEGGIVAPNVYANCGASDDPSFDGVKLRPCSVCKTAKYCGRGCQAHFRSTLS